MHVFQEWSPRSISALLINILSWIKKKEMSSHGFNLYIFILINFWIHVYYNNNLSLIWYEHAACSNYIREIIIGLHV